MQRIDRLTAPPVIGKFYLVPVVRAWWCHLVSDWPVHGPKHTDADIIGFEPEHWHVDSRFLTAAQYSSAMSYYGWTGIGAFHASPISRTNHVSPFNVPLPEPQFLRRRMARDYEPWPRHKAKKWMPSLEAAYADCRLKPGMVCPHRGAPLATVKPDENGIITCPLHGLRWHAESGALVTEERAA